MKPTCCGRNATPYQRLYGKPPHSIEEGFRCKTCGRIRIPHTFDHGAAKRYEDSMDALAARGRAED